MTAQQDLFSAIEGANASGRHVPGARSNQWYAAFLVGLCAILLGWSGMAAKPDAPAADGARDVAARHIRDRAQGESNRNGSDAARKHEIYDTVLRSRAGAISQWQTGDARADASISAQSRSE